MPEQPVVEAHPQTPDPVAQAKTIRKGKGRYSHEGNYSHDEELPVKFRIKRTSWLGRKISATTLEPVYYRDAIHDIQVPAGFTYDLASIPRVLWVFVAPTDIALESLFHDLLYRKQEVRRRVADQTLLSMMEDRSVPWHIRWAVYFSVRLFGWRAWEMRRAEMESAITEAERVADVTGEPLEMPSAVAPDSKTSDIKKN